MRGDLRWRCATRGHAPLLNLLLLLPEMGALSLLDKLSSNSIDKHRAHRLLTVLGDCQLRSRSLVRKQGRGLLLLSLHASHARRVHSLAPLLKRCALPPLYPLPAPTAHELRDEYPAAACR